MRNRSVRIDRDQARVLDKIGFHRLETGLGRVEVMLGFLLDLVGVVGRPRGVVVRVILRRNCGDDVVAAEHGRSGSQTGPRQAALVDLPHFLQRVRIFDGVGHGQIELGGSERGSRSCDLQHRLGEFHDAALGIESEAASILPLRRDVFGVERTVPENSGDQRRLRAQGSVAVGIRVEQAVFDGQDLPQAQHGTVETGDLKLSLVGQGGRRLDSIPAIDGLSRLGAGAGVFDVGKAEPGFILPAASGHVAQGVDRDDRAAGFLTDRFEPKHRLEAGRPADDQQRIGPGGGIDAEVPGALRSRVGQIGPRSGRLQRDSSREVEDHAAAQRFGQRRQLVGRVGIHPIGLGARQVGQARDVEFGFPQRLQQQCGKFLRSLFGGRIELAIFLADVVPAADLAVAPAPAAVENRQADDHSRLVAADVGAVEHAVGEFDGQVAERDDQRPDFGGQAELRSDFDECRTGTDSVREGE